ncbi:siderophore-interacting protein [Rathayibacter oskolensis]|uniref:siderophore-interacting protein n=1 Tax=Rathayibacter oskolensis TaxID=1891671 RepID=UPI00346786BA
MTDASDAPRPPLRERRTRSQHVLTVLRTERLAEHLVRVHLGGEGVDGFLAEADAARLAATDRYVKLLLPPAGSPLEPPFDLDALRASVAPEDLPVRRTYTVRSVGERSIAVDFVVHGDEGVAGPWAAAARPGDRLAMSAPVARGRRARTRRSRTSSSATTPPSRRSRRHWRRWALRPAGWH